MTEAHGGALRSLYDRVRSGINLSFGGGGSFVGLSIGASSVKVVELKKSGKQWSLTRYASVPIHDGMSDQRDIIQPAQIVSAIKTAIKESGIQSKNVCSALAGNSLIIKNLVLNVTNKKELQDQVYWEAEQYIPFAINEVVVDYQVLGESQGDHVEVILVAAKKNFLEQYLSVIEQSNLKPKVVDSEWFALLNTYELNYPQNPSESTLLVDVGALSTKMVVCSNGIPYFTKDTSFGGLSTTHEIQKELNLPRMEDAENLKVSTVIPNEVSEILNRSSQNLAGEIKKAIDFYSASSLGPPVTHIYLSGGASRIQSLVRTVREYTSIPCDYLNPFNSVIAKIQGSPEEFSKEVAIPMGLALRAGSGK